MGVAAEDIDGDGRKEVVAGKIDADKKWTLYWYKSGPDLHGPWQSTKCWTLKWQGIHTTFSSEIWTEMGDGNW